MKKKNKEKQEWRRARCSCVVSGVMSQCLLLVRAQCLFSYTLYFLIVHLDILDVLTYFSLEGTKKKTSLFNDHRELTKGRRRT